MRDALCKYRISRMVYLQRKIFSSGNGDIYFPREENPMPLVEHQASGELRRTTGKRCTETCKKNVPLLKH